MDTQLHGEPLSELPEGRLFATVPEFVKVSGYDQRTVRKGIEAGEIPAFRVGATWRIPVAWIRDQARLAPMRADMARGRPRTGNGPAVPPSPPATLPAVADGLAAGASPPGRQR